MSDLDKLLFSIKDYSKLNKVWLDNAKEEVAIMRGLLDFALINHSKFTEHDPDGVKAQWIKQVKKWDKMP